MSELLYHTDAYLREFDAVVTAVDTDQNAVSLDRTAFYLGGGGQPSDTGTLQTVAGAFTVLAMKRPDLHVLKEPPPAVGSTVRGVVDWERRYLLMRTHTAMHVLCGVVWRDYGAQVTGGNMEPGAGRMDFEFTRLDAALLEEIESKVNAEISAGRDLRVRILPREEAFRIPDLIRTKINLLPEDITEVRTVEIAGLDLQADGGTHVANTGEVGTVRLPKFKNKGGANKRIYLELMK
ncbi:MAG: alanyl-tRNA editing protein [Spirochaetaceae bacterium]